MLQKAKTKNFILYISGLLVSVVPPIFATLSYFPIWKNKQNGSLLCGWTLLLILLAGKPVYNHLKRTFSSPAAYTMWFVIFSVFFALSKIADEITVIAFVGFVSNLIAALFFKASGIKRSKGEHLNE